MTTYCDRNFKTKKALKDAVAAGDEVGVFSAGLGEPPETGETSVSGPHYPAAHSWYARVRLLDGVIVKVLS